MWHCLVIEDDRENARYIANGLSELGHIVVIASDGVQALDRAIKSSWDIIILDRMLPHGIDGLSILSTLRSLGKKTPVLILSALTALDDRISGLEAGGDDYLVKPFAFSELLARIKALLRRSQVGDDQTALHVGDLRIDLSTSKVARDGKAIALQPREFRLLAYLMRNAHNVVTRTMLLEEVWDYRFDPQSNVIDVHVSRLRRKIDAGFSISLIHTIRGAGYMLSDRNEPHCTAYQA